MQLSCPDRSYRPSLAWLSLLLVLLACAQAPISQVANAAMAEDRCSMSAQAPQRITLPDGSRVLMNASSMAVQGDDVLILGSPFYLFDRPGQEALSESAVGLVWSEAGQISLVPSPLPTRELHELQAVAANEGGWHVLFVTGTRRAVSYDSADIWYAHYDGRAWTETQLITRARAARLSPTFASNLMETKQGIAFAFAFDRSSESRLAEEVSEGAVMLLKRKNGWTHDTLPTWSAPRSIKLAAPDGKLRAIFSQSYFADKRLRGPALFTADYDSTWQAPRIVYDPEPEYNPAAEYVNTVMMPKGGDNARGVAWRVATKGNFEGDARLEWGVISDDGTIQRWSVTNDFIMSTSAVIDIAGRTTVMLARHGDSREQLRAFAATDAGIHYLGVVTTPPLMNFLTPAVPLKDGRIIAVTTGPDHTPGIELPLVASYLTEITVRCAVDRT